MGFYINPDTGKEEYKIDEYGTGMTTTQDTTKKDSQPISRELKGFGLPGPYKQDWSNQPGKSTAATLDWIANQINPLYPEWTGGPSASDVYDMYGLFSKTLSEDSQPQDKVNLLNYLFDAIPGMVNFQNMPEEVKKDWQDKKYEYIANIESPYWTTPQESMGDQLKGLINTISRGMTLTPETQKKDKKYIDMSEEKKAFEYERMRSKYPLDFQGLPRESWEGRQDSKKQKDISVQEEAQQSIENLMTGQEFIELMKRLSMNDYWNPGEQLQNIRQENK